MGGEGANPGHRHRVTYSWGSDMVGSTRPPDIQVLEALTGKLWSLGLDDEDDQQAFLGLVKGKRSVGRGEGVLDRTALSRHFTVLLSGIACLCGKLKDGGRHIYTYYYPGDFCGLYRHEFPEPDQDVAVAALNDCSTGLVYYDDLDRMVAQQPKLAIAVWRAAMLEASIIRERQLDVSRRSALSRVASLLCEQVLRLETIGSSGADIPLSQMDLADGTRLTVADINRILQDLRKLGVLSDRGFNIEVVDWERLVDIGKFLSDMTCLRLPMHIELAEFAPNVRERRRGNGTMNQ